MKGKTASGFAFDIDENVRESWDFFTAIADAESDDASRQISGVRNIVTALLGTDEKQLMHHIRDKEGAVSVSSVMREVTDILGQMNVKN